MSRRCRLYFLMGNFLPRIVADIVHVMITTIDKSPEYEENETPSLIPYVSIDEHFQGSRILFQRPHSTEILLDNVL